MNNEKRINEERMQEELVKIFQNAKLAPHENLAIGIWRVIIAREKRRRLVRLWSFAAVELVSLAGLVPAFKTLWSDIVHSGFYDYVSLIFSGGAPVASYWREILLSLAESLPVNSVLLTLCVFFVCFLALRYLIRQVAKNTPILQV